MGVALKLKIRHPGSSQIDQYVGKNGKIVTKKIVGAIEDTIVDVAGKRIIGLAKQQRERTLYLAAAFFQHVVNRTPMDEEYEFTLPNGTVELHEPDDDYVRDAWVASYNNRKVTAKQLREAGITFEKFNDEAEIKKIYEVFKKAFVQRKDRGIKQIHIENTHKRFAMLEYGEYTKDSRPANDGNIGRPYGYEHGIENGYSVQAPHGMLRITEAEFQGMTLNNKVAYKKEFATKTAERTKIPSAADMRELKKLILDKKHLTEDDLTAIERIYGL